MPSPNSTATVELSRCVCGHTAHWHSHHGTGSCEHDGLCRCRKFREAPTVGAFCDDLGRILTWSDRRMLFNVLAHDGHRFEAGSYVEVLTQPDDDGNVEVHQRGHFALVLSVDLDPVADRELASVNALPVTPQEDAAWAEREASGR